MLDNSIQAFDAIREGLAKMYMYFEVENDQVLTEGLAAVEVAVQDLDDILGMKMEQENALGYESRDECGACEC